MKIVQPEVQLLEQGEDIIAHVARCGRICYDKEVGNNDQTLYNNLIKDNHWSVFRHASYYAIIPHSDYNSPAFSLAVRLNVYPYKTIGASVNYDMNNYYVAYNGNFALDYPNFHNNMIEYLVSPKEFANTEIGHSMMRYTFRIITQDATAKELNRVSPNNITEMSTRYVDLRNGAICRPHWLEGYSISQGINGTWYIYINGNADEDINHKVLSYLQSCERAFNSYEYLIKAGMKREDARGVLSKDTATKVIYTYDVNTWKHIIELRSDKKAHPNAAIIANMIKEELEEFGYDFK